MNHGIGIIAHKMCCFILCVCYAGFAQGQALSSTDPSDKTATNGNIVIHGLVAGTAYNISYTKDGTNVPAAPFNADDGGNVILPALGIGTYTNFNIVKPAIAAVAAVPAIPAAGGAPAVPAVAAVAAVPATTTILPNSVVLVPNTIAVQATKFFGAVYGNFTGVPDDDPTSFVQTYARLSQPLNGVDGIANNAPFKDRNIFFRNFIAQLTYGNTDNFKTYTVDTLGDKYTNRLDLLAHAFYNGELALNIVTFILPNEWNGCKGDAAHLYVDFFSSFIATHVTDTFTKSDPSTLKTYIVESSIFGINAKAAFTTPAFNIEAAAKIFEIHPWSSTVNPNLNVQTASESDVYLKQNTNKTFIRQSNPPYFQFDIMVQYNTGTLPAVSANQSKTASNSNVFLKFSHITNFANPTGNHYSNSYFQLQLGYALDITKLLNPQ